MSRPSFTCPRCGRTSYNPGDVLYGYCGACHDYTREPPIDYLDLLPVGRRRTWPELERQMAEIAEICRQHPAMIVWPWQGHNIFRAVFGFDAPADKQFSLHEIKQLAELYIEKMKGEKEKKEP